MNTKVNRYLSLDVLRGFAVFIMIIFHFCYDLNIFKFIKINMSDTFWFYYPRFIVFCFLTSVGISLKLVHKNKIKWDKVWPRFVKLALAALAITVVTYFLFPRNWIYFGTLHCIATASLLALPFLNREKLSIMAIVLIIGS
jgi:uncharacterized membrane protein